MMAGAGSAISVQCGLGGASGALFVLSGVTVLVAAPPVSLLSPNHKETGKAAGHTMYTRGMAHKLPNFHTSQDVKHKSAPLPPPKDAKSRQTQIDSRRVSNASREMFLSISHTPEPDREPLACCASGERGPRGSARAVPTR